MAGRATIILGSPETRRKAAMWAMNLRAGTRVEFKETKRSIPQNDKLWATLTDVSQQVVWHGQKLTPEDWKDMFTASLRKARVVPGIDPGSFVLLGLHTSDMSKGEMSDLLELIHAFGAERGVVFHDQQDRAA
jgi:hypothetical protein